MFNNRKLLRYSFPGRYRSGSRARVHAFRIHNVARARLRAVTRIYYTRLLSRVSRAYEKDLDGAGRPPAPPMRCAEMRIYRNVLARKYKRHLVIFYAYGSDGALACPRKVSVTTPASDRANSLCASDDGNHDGSGGVVPLVSLSLSQFPKTTRRKRKVPRGGAVGAVASCATAEMEPSALISR